MENKIIAIMHSKDMIKEVLLSFIRFNFCKGNGLVMVEILKELLSIFYSIFFLK